MFRPEEMTRVDVMVLQSDLRAAVTALGRLGCAHLMPARSKESGELLEAMDIEERRETAQALMARIVALRDRLGLKPSAGGGFGQALSAETAKKGLDDLEKSIGKALDEREEAMETLADLQRQEKDLTLLAPLPAEALAPDRQSFITIRVGWLQPEQADELAVEANFAIIVPLEKLRDKELIAAVVSRKKRFALQTILEKLGFVPHGAPDTRGLDPAVALQRNRETQNALAARIDELNAKINEFTASVKEQINSFIYWLRTEVSVCAALEQFGKTRLTCVAAGWVPTADTPRLREKLTEATEGRAMIKTRRVSYGDASYGAIPVKARLNAFFRPFRVLVANYGLPTYSEIEPTAFVAISFLIMFGIMFGDLGQGAILTVCGMLLRGRARKEWARDFGFVLAAAGISAMFFGAVIYGSFFGREGVLPTVPGVTMQLLGGGGANVSRLFVVAVLTGIVLMSIGIMLNIINNYSRRGFYQGTLDKFGLVGLAFYWGTLAILLFNSKSLPVIIAAVVLPLALLLLAEPLRHLISRRKGEHEESLAMSVIESAVDTMETVIVYLANTMSFLRLAGFALAHAGLSLAMWTMFDALRSVPLVPWAIVILGNVLVIALEGLVAGIQSMRLEYYEFFGKFFRGEGKAFEPFRIGASSEE